MSITALQVESLPLGAESMYAWLRDAEAVLGRAADLDGCVVAGGWDERGGGGPAGRVGRFAGRA
jgi:hypothetical protein